MLRSGVPMAIAIAIAGCGGSDPMGSDDSCAPDDADGVMGGNAVFDLKIYDDHVDPAILTAQNNANVTLAVHDMGTKPHDFTIDCLATRNDDGCPMTSCFPTSAKTGPLDPGASATVLFVVPRVEGIYWYHSDVPGDVAGPCGANVSDCGQFVVR